MTKLEEVINLCVTSTIVGTLEMSAAIFETMGPHQFTGDEIAAILRKAATNQEGHKNDR